MPGIRFLRSDFQFRFCLVKPVSLPLLDCKAFYLLWLVSALLLDLGTPVPCIVLGEI